MKPKTSLTNMNQRTLILVSPHGFCAGVERAVQIAQTMLDHAPAPVYCLKEIVHNRQVIDALRAKGVLFVQTLDDIPPGSRVLFSAHGVPPATWERAREHHLLVTDATCPFVTKVHQEARRYASQGCTIILIGHRKHDEVIGVAGEAPDSVKVVETADEARDVTVTDPDRVAVLTQTTLSPDEVTPILAALRNRFPSLRTPATDDICYATRNRQQAVREAAPHVDAFIVLGSENSSNSNRLVEVARAAGCPAAYLAGTLDKIASLPLDPVHTLGLTAGASTPEHVVKAAIEYLRSRGFATIEERTVITEDMHFPLPKSLP
jgi:4-hydroxy-3-methylbut-2-enyl diphosphate reductase